MSTGGKKICIYCGADCSQRPRVKNDAGAYACRSCATVWKQASQRAGAEPPASGPKKHPEPEVRPSPARAPEMPAAEPDDLVIPDDVGVSKPDEGHNTGIYALAEPEANQSAKVACPGCGVSMSADAVVCSRCGFDRKRGIQFGTARDDDGPCCPGCGYSLRGLRGRTCPECGSAIPRRGSRAEAIAIEQRQARDFASWEYRRPALYLLVGLLGTIVHGLSQSNTTILVSFPLGLVVSTIAGVIAFYLLSLVLWGFDAPIGLIALRLAGINALTHLIWLVVSFTGLGFAAWGARVVVFYLLVMQEFDIDDYREVWLLSVLMQVLSVLGLWWVASLM